jgi:hypothetical protein
MLSENDLTHFRSILVFAYPVHRIYEPIWTSRPSIFLIVAGLYCVTARPKKWARHRGILNPNLLDGGRQYRASLSYIKLVMLQPAVVTILTILLLHRRERRNEKSFRHMRPSIWRDRAIEILRNNEANRDRPRERDRERERERYRWSNKSESGARLASEASRPQAPSIHPGSDEGGMCSCERGSAGSCCQCRPADCRPYRGA